MNTEAIRLEERRLEHIEGLEDYDMIHERHRIFPALFENRRHQRILDLSAGMGAAASRIQKQSPCELICNDICPKCLRSLKNLGLATVSFDLDDAGAPFPFPPKRFDAIISLSTIEHLIHIDHFLLEIYRLLADEGRLYLSSPNYASLSHLIPYILSGRSFHDPLAPGEQYEFYAHYRYFTYVTLLEYVSSFGFCPEAVYIGKPEGSSYYRRLRRKSKWKALFFKAGLTFLCHALPPRWASEPVICFHKGISTRLKPRKVVL